MEPAGEGSAATAGLPAGFTVNPWGRGEWRTGGAVYLFPASRRSEWAAAVRMIEDLGSPFAYEGAWDSVSSEVIRWLEPRRA